MKRITLLLIATIVLFSANNAFAQDDKEITPEEYAEKQVKTLTTKLELSESQEFYVDSILTTNFVALKKAIEDLQRSGMQDPQTYRKCNEMWQEKTIAAMKKVLDEQQFIKYLKYMGKGKEYKKGKDGKYYLKSELKKK
ncbi:MAG: hypothetical protein J5604_04480 [Bacteroidales bacterium]|nr:hypothetical protein [Bacteroidales bacterium]